MEPPEAPRAYVCLSESNGTSTVAAVGSADKSKCFANAASYSVAFLRLEGERKFVPLERMQANILLRPTTTCSGNSRVVSAPMLLSRSHPRSPFATECIPHTKSKLATHHSVLSVNLTSTSSISSNIRPYGNWPSGFRLVGYLSKHQTTSHRAVASAELFPRWQSQYLRRWYVLPSRMQTSRLRKIFNLPF